MKKMIALSLLIAVGTLSAEAVKPLEELTPIQKLSMLGEVYTLICLKATGERGNYYADEDLGKKTDYLQYWVCKK